MFVARTDRRRADDLGGAVTLHGVTGTEPRTWDRDTLPEGEEKQRAVRDMFDAIAPRCFEDVPLPPPLEQAILAAGLEQDWL